MWDEITVSPANELIESLEIETPWTLETKQTHKRYHSYWTHSPPTPQKKTPGPGACMWDKITVSLANELIESLEIESPRTHKTMQIHHCTATFNCMGFSEALLILNSQPSYPKKRPQDQVHVCGMKLPFLWQMSWLSPLRLNPLRRVKQCKMFNCMGFREVSLILNSPLPYPQKNTPGLGMWDEITVSLTNESIESLEIESPRTHKTM